MSRPSRIAQYPPLQGQFDRPPSKWVNQREIGRLFGISTAAVKEHLTALGWRTATRAATPQALSEGAAKPIIRKEYGAGVQAQTERVAGYRWHTEKVVAALAKRGLEPLSRRDVLAHSLADAIQREIKSVVAALGSGRSCVDEEAFAKEVINRRWALGRLTANLECVPVEDQPHVMGTLGRLLRQKGHPPALVRAFFQAAGLTHLADAWEMDQALQKASATAAPARPARL